MAHSSANSIRVFAEAAVAIVLLGCVPAVVKSISANAFTVGIFRLAVATACTAVVLWSDLRFSSVPFKHWVFLVGLGLLFGLHWLIFFYSIKISSASTALIGLSTYGVHLIILGWLVGNTPATLFDGLAVGAAIVGGVLLVPEFSLGNHTSQGLLLAVVSGFLYACLPILHQRYPHLSSSMRAFGQFVFALTFFLIFLPFSRKAARWVATEAHEGQLRHSHSQDRLVSLGGRVPPRYNAPSLQTPADPTSERGGDPGRDPLRGSARRQRADSRRRQRPPHRCLCLRSSKCDRAL